MMNATMKHTLSALAGLLSGTLAMAQAPTTASTDSGLIKNGDFEVAVDPAECRQMAAWTFETEEAPQGWEFHNQTGIALLGKGDAASGSRFLRIKNDKTQNAIIMQQITLNAAGSVQVSMKLRGSGTIGIYRLCYNKQTGKYLKTPQLGASVKLSSKEWVDFNETYPYDGNTNEYLGLFVTSKEGVDIDKIVVKYAPETAAAAAEKK